jgi:acyl-CoA synthetase (AMP-forming)/AMP-acid ligase II/acyl carrier protein
MDQGSEILNNEVPVGFPMEDKYISLIDDDGREVGFNAVGEIVVRSKYLSPGYWNNPDLTRTKFNNDPEDPNIRIYYTGDFGLMRPDGCLIHKGRKDSRIKIRGYAVDLVEVEETLRNHTEITDAVAIARPDESGEARLIAYFISRSQPGPVVSELRSFMKETLAEYSVPSVYVKIDRIPLTPNGKVDRQALPEPGIGRPELSAAYEPPKSLVEQRLAEFWAEILSVDRVGVHDDFFDLGGHSLSGTRLLSWIRETFKVDLPVSEFFVNPTIAELAQRIHGLE